MLLASLLFLNFCYEPALVCCCLGGFSHSILLRNDSLSPLLQYLARLSINFGVKGWIPFSFLVLVSCGSLPDIGYGFHSLLCTFLGGLPLA